MIIRKVDPKRDVVDITTINRRYVETTTINFETRPISEEEMLARITSIAEKFPYFVCEKDGNVLGYAYAHLWKERAAYHITWESTIYISPDKRGRGIGRQLMDKLINECKALGCHSLIACITAENESSCRFHEKLGFTKVSHFKEVGQKFGRLLDVADYQKIL